MSEKQEARIEEATCSDCNHPKSWHNDPSAYQLDCQGSSVSLVRQADGTYKRFVLGCSCNLKHQDVEPVDTQE